MFAGSANKYRSIFLSFIPMRLGSHIFLVIVASGLTTIANYNYKPN